MYTKILRTFWNSLFFFYDKTFWSSKRRPLRFLWEDLKDFKEKTYGLLLAEEQNSKRRPFALLWEVILIFYQKCFWYFMRIPSSITRRPSLLSSAFLLENRSIFYETFWSSVRNPFYPLWEDLLTLRHLRPRVYKKTLQAFVERPFGRL